MVSVTEEEKSLDYYKYFLRPLAAVDAAAAAIADGEPLGEADILPIEERNAFLAGTHGKAEIGFALAPNGTGYVANKLFMPKVESEMLDWWFGWHAVDSDLRYKLWDHDDHYYARADKADYVKDKSVPLAQKTWGVSHSIKEDVGGGAEEFVIHFLRPRDAGYDESLIGGAKCTSLVVGAGEGNPALMTHKWYRAEGGVWFESRFWMGYTIVNGAVVKVIPDGVSLPEIAARNMLRHGIKEYTNLASLLPELYGEHKGDI